MHVLIIGAGLGGLTLAQNLRQKDIDFEIFERDKGLDARVQGWALTLHRILLELRNIMPSAPSLQSVSVTADTGQPDEAAFFNAYTKEVQWRGDGSSGNDQPFIRANRSKLCMWLSTGLDIQVKKRFLRFETDEEGVTAFFVDGGIAPGNIIVGADGVQSKVRECMHAPNSPQPNVLPAGILSGEVTLSQEQYTRQFALARSFWMANGNGFRLFLGLKQLAHDRSTAEYYWRFCWADNAASQPGFWTETASPEKQLAFAKEKVKNIHEDFREILEYQPPERMLKPFVMRDLILDGLPDGLATLIGDAAHLMSIFRGEGANQAMLDAIELSKQLQMVQAHNLTADSYANALRTYASEMIPRASKAVLESRDAVNM